MRSSARPLRVSPACGCTSSAVRACSNVIAIKQAYPATRAGGVPRGELPVGSYLGRFVVVVAEDVDPSDLFDVMWAMCTRCDPASDIELFAAPGRAARSDPRQGIIDNSRAVIDACRPYERLKDFPLVARASPELRKQVAENSPISSARSARRKLLCRPAFAGTTDCIATFNIA